MVLLKELRVGATLPIRKYANIYIEKVLDISNMNLDTINNRKEILSIEKDIFSDIASEVQEIISSDEREQLKSLLGANK